MEYECGRCVLSKALWPGILPRGGEEEVRALKDSHAGALRTHRLQGSAAFKAELVFLVSRERIAVLVVLVASMPLNLGNC